MSELNVAVLIDYENVGVETLPSLFDKISEMGRVVVKRAYADWSKAKEKDRDHLLALGIEAIQNFHAARSAKNSSDIRLAIDAVELLHTAPVDAFVIVSADSDFVSLVSKLRAGGKHVIGAGRQAIVSPTLVQSCDRYIFLEKEVQLTGMDGKAIPEATQQLVLRAVRASSDESGRVLGARLHNTMLRIDPSFEFKSLGFRTFFQFLEGCEGMKVSKPKIRGDVLVELN